jgi:hypothetical protein
VGMSINLVTTEKVWSFLKKLKMEASYHPTIPLLNISAYIQRK